MQNGRSSRFVWCDAIIGDPTQHVYLIARYLGAIIGRTCDRIADGKFSLEGEDYQVPTFKKLNFLHKPKQPTFSWTWMMLWVQVVASMEGKGNWPIPRCLMSKFRRKKQLTTWRQGLGQVCVERATGRGILLPHAQPSLTRWWSGLPWGCSCLCHLRPRARNPQFEVLALIAPISKPVSQDDCNGHQNHGGECDQPHLFQPWRCGNYCRPLGRVAQQEIHRFWRQISWSNMYLPCFHQRWTQLLFLRGGLFVSKEHLSTWQNQPGSERCFFLTHHCAPSPLQWST